MDDSTVLSSFPAAALFCNHRFLRAFQLAEWRPFPDSKTLVDLPLRISVEDALREFDALPDPLPEPEGKAFLARVFHPSPEDDRQLLPHTPADHTSALPAFAAAATGPGAPALRAFAGDLKTRWASLCRVHSGGGAGSSLIGLPHPFFVPGGRFREVYYWDTLWIVHGLLACDMVQSAQLAVRNLLALVRKLGFVPNGTRVYYLNRSQPPVLADAVAAVLARLPNESAQTAWLEEAVPLLEREYAAFAECRAAPPPHTALNVYCVRAAAPRPESFREDILTGDAAAAAAPPDSAEQARTQAYADLAAAAESGWDFSSRWLRDPSDLATIRTSQVLPVCLNSVLLRGEDLLRGFHLRLAAAGDPSRRAAHIAGAARFARAFDARAAAMRSTLWDGTGGLWRDAVAPSGAHTAGVSAAALMPAWAGAARAGVLPRADAARLVRAVLGAGLLGPGGLAATALKTGQQWDFPNAWAPLGELAVGALRALHAQYPGIGADAAARDVARNTLRAMFRAWRRDGAMFEKYDATEGDGRRGAGGEYAPQVGFGWSNGAALRLMEVYANDIAEQRPAPWFD